MNTRRHFLQTSAAAFTAATAGRPLFASAAAAPAGGSKIKIGQIGTGHAHASGKMEAMRGLADYEVVGIAEPDPARAARAKDQKAYVGLTWMSVEQLLSTPGLQAVAIETTVKDLVPMAKLAVQAGLHLHLDKPAGESLPEFRALHALAAEKKRTIQMGYMLRYNPAFELLFRLLKEGALGEVFSIDAAMSKLMPVGQRGGLLEYRGGIMFELGCHIIDSAVYILGKPDKVAAYNRTSGADGYADNALAVLEYPQATVTIRSALLEVEGGARRQFVVCGTKGTFDIRPLESGQARLALQEPHGEYRKGYQDLKFPRGGGRYDGEFSDLARIIRGEKALAWTPEHDLAVHETVLRASGLPVS